MCYSLCWKYFNIIFWKDKVRKSVTFFWYFWSNILTVYSISCSRNLYNIYSTFLPLFNTFFRNFLLDYLSFSTGILYIQYIYFSTQYKYEDDKNENPWAY